MWLNSEQWGYKHMQTIQMSTRDDKQQNTIKFCGLKEFPKY